MRTSLVRIAAAVAVAAIGAPGTARANGRLPTANALLFAPNDPNFVLLRTTFGVLISRDGGGTWDWLCESALGIGATQAIDPSLGVTSSGALVAGFLDKLLLSSAAACDWSRVSCPFVGQTIVDLTVRPDDPRVVLALASTAIPVGAADAGSTCAAPGIDAGIGDSGVGYLNQVFVSVDEGAHWSALGTPLSPTALMMSIEVAATDPQRVYVSGFRPVGDLRDTVLFVSLDDGAHWTERPTPPLNQTTEAAAYIAAVDPSNADLVYLRTGGLGASRLFVTANAGSTFQIPLTLTHQMLGFALSADGATVYAGGPADGLYSATRSNLTFARVSTLGVECLATHGPDLWACSADGPGGFIAGESTDDGATFAAKLHLNGIRAPVSCDADAAAAQCTGAAFQQLCQAFHCGGLAGDAGGADAGPAPGDAGGDGAAPPVAPASRSSCGCSVVGHGGATASTGMGLLVAVGAFRRRSRASVQPIM